MIKKVTFIGSKHLGIKALEKMYSLAPDKLHSIITIDDSNDVRCKLDKFIEFSKRTDTNVYILTKPSELESVLVEDLPDICIVVGWYWIIAKKFLKFVPNGFIGIHASLLPKYRGSAPLVWSIVNGDKESGVSLFYFDEKMDAGDIVAQKQFNIENDDTIAEVMEKAISIIFELLNENYPLILEGKSPKNPQNHDDATYCSQRKPEDGRIDWNSSNIKIHNSIRAQTHPYPGAYCYTKNNEKLYIWKSKLFTKQYYGIPGFVAQVCGNSVIVACGKGAVCLYEVQPESSTQKNANKVLKYGMRLK